ARSARLLGAIVTGLILPVAVWQIVQLVLLGWEGFLRHIQDQSAILSVSANVPPLSRAALGAQYVVSSAVGLVDLAGLGYVWHRAQRPGPRCWLAPQLFLAAFATAWLVWYLGFSMGWPRYTVALVGTGSLFAAVLFCDLYRAVRSRLRVALLLVLAAP